MPTVEIPVAGLAGSGAPVQYPTASSRLLLDLLRLSRSTDGRNRSEAPADALALDGVIPKPVLRSLLAALQLRDPNTVQHVRRTALFATGLARFLGWEGVPLRKLEIAALLHDIGKIGVPDHVLFKPGPLNPAEQELFALQHHVGMDVLQACRVHQEVLDIINQSNPNYDNGVRNNTELNLGARILAIADAYDSLSNKQVYRDAKTHDEILAILGGSAGTRFDGNLVNVMNRWVQAEGLPFTQQLAEPQSAMEGSFLHLAEEMQASSMCHIFSYLYVLESMYDGFYLLDAELQFRIWNTGMERLLGRSAVRMLGQRWSSKQVEFADQHDQHDQHDQLMDDLRQPIQEVIKTGKPLTTQLKVKHLTGQWLNVEVMSVPLFDHNGSLQGIAEIFRDISTDRRRRREDKDLRQQATRDSLTGVANRGELERTLESMLAEFGRKPNAEPFSLIFLDVDHFKRINDTYLHLTGDEVLVGLAKLLQSETYSGELICRYGGEEFVVLCPATNLDQAYAKAERLRMALSDAVLSSVKELKVTASFGVTQVESGDRVDDILRRADKALFASKDGGRNRTTPITRQDFVNGSLDLSRPKEVAKPSYVFEGSFLACITDDMVVLKFGSFVKEQQAKLIDAKHGKVVLRLGNTLLLPFWGSSPKRQPVELQIKFGPPPKHVQQTIKQGASERTYFGITITPRGWAHNVPTFQARARRAFLMLKSYFVAD